MGQPINQRAIAETNQFLDDFARDASRSGDIVQQRRERRRQARAETAAVEAAAKADRTTTAVECGRRAAIEIFRHRDISPAVGVPDDVARERVQIILGMGASSRDDYRALPILERLAFLEGCEAVAGEFGYKVKL